MEELFTQWDNVSAAIDRVVTALPAQMTEAAARLEEERRSMRIIINKVGLSEYRKEPRP